MVWESFLHDPRDPAHASLRASDADRDVVRVALADAFADGRLDRDEYDERSDTLNASRTLGELPPILADLVSSKVVPTRPAREPVLGGDAIQAKAVAQYERARREAFLGFLGPSAITVAIWAVVDWGDWSFFWPVFVIIGTLMNLVRVVVRKQDLIADNVAGLERRQAKELRKRQLAAEPPPPIGPPEPQG